MYNNRRYSYGNRSNGFYNRYPRRTTDYRYRQNYRFSNRRGYPQYRNPRGYSRYPRQGYSYGHGGNRYQAAINRVLSYTARHPIVARSIYNAIGRQQGYQAGYQTNRRFTPRAQRAQRAPQTAPVRPQSHPGYNKQHPYYAHLYVSKAWVGDNPKTHQPVVYTVVNRRRDIDPNAKLAGAHVFRHQGRDGKSYYDQPLSTKSFNKIREATGRSAMSNQQYQTYVGSHHLFASTQDGLAFDAHIFKNRTPNKPAYQNAYLISVKSIKNPSRQMNTTVEQKLDQQAYQQQEQRNAQNQAPTNNAPTNGAPQSNNNAPSGSANAPQGSADNNINPFAGNMQNQNEDDGPEA